MARWWSPRLSTGLLLAVVLWQVSSCCCCLGGAVTPPMTPVPISRELAVEMRERVNEAKSRSGTVEIAVTDQELTSYVVGLLQSGAGEFPARDMQIRFGDGVVEVWATFIDIAPSEIPAYVRGAIVVVDGALVFQIEQANAGPFPVPGALRETISQILSESLDELQIGIEFERVRILKGEMIVLGQVTGSPPDLP